VWEAWLNWNLPSGESSFIIGYESETWSLTLWERHRLEMFENRLLIRIFGCKRKNVIGEWEKLDKEELLKFYFSPSIIRVIK
jgi:hypothetical protein